MARRVNLQNRLFFRDWIVCGVLASGPRLTRHTKGGVYRCNGCGARLAERIMIVVSTTRGPSRLKSRTVSHEIREKSEIKREEIRNQKDWKSNQTLS